MIYLSIGLLFLGALLLCAEAFIPGFGIVGTAGIIAIIVSSVITAFAVPYGSLIVISEIIVLTVTIYLLLRFFKKKQLYDKIVLSETVKSEENNVGDLSYFIGKEGLTKTALRPFGTVDFNGVTVEVCSDDGYTDARKLVVVTEIKQKKIMVKTVDNENGLRYTRMH